MCIIIYYMPITEYSQTQICISLCIFKFFFVFSSLMQIQVVCNRSLIHVFHNLYFISKCICYNLCCHRWETSFPHTERWDVENQRRCLSSSNPQDNISIFWLWGRRFEYWPVSLCPPVYRETSPKSPHRSSIFSHLLSPPPFLSLPPSVPLPLSLLCFFYKPTSTVSTPGITLQSTEGSSNCIRQGESPSYTITYDASQPHGIIYGL